MQGQHCCGAVDTVQNGHKVFSRLYLPSIGDPLYTGPIEVW